MREKVGTSTTSTGANGPPTMRSRNPLRNHPWAISSPVRWVWSTLPFFLTMPPWMTFRMKSVPASSKPIHPFNSLSGSLWQQPPVLLNFSIGCWSQSTRCCCSAFPAWCCSFWATVCRATRTMFTELNSTSIGVTLITIAMTLVGLFAMMVAIILYIMGKQVARIQNQYNWPKGS